MSEYDPHDIRGQERAKSQKDTAAQIARDTEEADIKWLVSSKRGRRIVWRMLEDARVFHPTFNTNAMQMAFNEGNRNAGNKLLTLVNNASPDALVTMITESKADQGKEQ